MKKKLLCIFLAFALVFSVSGCGKTNTEEPDKPSQGQQQQQQNPISVLAENGVTEYRIIIPQGADAAIGYASEELEYFFKSTTGATIIVGEDTGTEYSEETKLISLGKTSALNAAVGEPDYTDFGTDGFFIKTVGKSVFIDGNTGRSVLYGTYDFIEKVLGVKFLTAERTYMPSLVKAELYSMNEREIPAIRNRLFLDYDTMTNYTFITRTRQTGEYANLSAEQGGGMKWFDGLPGETFHPTHNTIYYVDPSTYQEHPDWFLWSNDTVKELHYSNTGILADGTVDKSLSESLVLEVFENLKRFIQNSDAVYFMLGQMDISYTCECEECLRQEKLYGRSGMNIRFINALSDLVSEWMKQENIDREIYLMTFAYSWSVKAPVDENGDILDPTVIPRDNVIVRIAPITMHNYFSFTDERQANDTRTLIEEWSKVAGRMMTWTYHTSYGSYFTYYPTMHTWKDNLQTLIEIGCEYNLMQSTYNEKNNWQSYIDFYVGSKMMWDPSLDATTLRDEFITYYYGIIADEVKEFIDNFDMQYALFFDETYQAGLVNKPNSSIQGASTLYSAELYTWGFWQRQLDLLDEMNRKIEQSDLPIGEKDFYFDEIKKISLTPYFMIIMSYDNYFQNDAAGKNQMMRTFFGYCSDLDVLLYCESYDIQYLKNLWGYNG